MSNNNRMQVHKPKNRLLDGLSQHRAVCCIGLIIQLLEGTVGEIQGG